MRLRLVSATLLAACTFSVQAQQCSAHQAERAQAAVDHLDSWRGLEAARRRFGQCDDGAIAEGFSEAVARLLVDRWMTLGELLSLTRHNAQLKTFVLKHIDSTLDTDDLARIEELARLKCPATQQATCREIARAAYRARQ